MSETDIYVHKKSISELICGRSNREHKECLEWQAVLEEAAKTGYLPFKMSIIKTIQNCTPRLAEKFLKAVEEAASPLPPKARRAFVPNPYPVDEPCEKPSEFYTFSVAHSEDFESMLASRTTGMKRFEGSPFETAALSFPEDLRPDVLRHKDKLLQTWGPQLKTVEAELFRALRQRVWEYDLARITSADLKVLVSNTSVTMNATFFVRKPQGFRCEESEFPANKVTLTFSDEDEVEARLF